MAFINHITKNLAIKVVYYGPGLSGKTTNLRYVFHRMDSSSRGDLICLETDMERTYFFDLLPVKAGLIGDYEVHFQLLTVPGQVFYEASRKSVLKGADGIVFIADSQVPLLDANLESFDGLRKNLLEQNVDLNAIPLVFQYNKRDLDNLIPVETFNNLLNPRKLPYVEASAINGVGVFETLQEIAKMTVPIVRAKVFGEPVRKMEQRETEKRIEEAVRETPEEKVPAEPEKAPPPHFASFSLKKVKIKTQEEIEKELERLSKEFAERAKDSSS